MRLRSTHLPLLAALSSALLLVTACGGSGDDDSSSGSGTSEAAFLVTYPGIDPASELLKAGAMEAGQKLGVTVVFRTPTKFDVAEQSVVTESALSTPNLKGVAVVAADPNSLEGVMRTAKDKGLALTQGAGCTPQATSPICFDTHPPSLGEMAGQRMGELLGPEGGEVVIASGGLGDVNNAARAKGFTEALMKASPNAKVVQTLYSCETSDKTRACAENALAAHPNLRGYFGNGGEASIGAAEVFPKAGKKVFVGALDDAPDTVSYLPTGEVSFTLVQPLKCMGYLLVYSNYLQAVKNMTATTKYVNLGATMVDKTNVGDLEAANQETCTKLLDQFDNVVFKAA